MALSLVASAKISVVASHVVGTIYKIFGNSTHKNVSKSAEVLYFPIKSESAILFLKSKS